MKKFIIPAIIISLIFGVFLIYSFNSVPQITAISNEGIEYKGSVCTSIIRADGTYEDNGCNHNVLFNKGANMTRAALGVGGTAAILNITLCNSTSSADTGCGAPVAAATELFTQYGSCGLSGATGTYTQLAQTGNWTVSNTFTSTCNNVVMNVTRLGNNSDYFAGNSFTSVTLQNLDQLTINWTLSVN